LTVFHLVAGISDQNIASAGAGFRISIQPTSIKARSDTVMGWSGRVLTPPAREAGFGGTKVTEHAMSQKHNTAIAVIGIDIGKNSPS